MLSTTRLFWFALTLLLWVGCTDPDSDVEDPPDMNSSDTADDEADDSGVQNDTGDDTPETWTFVYVEDQTRPGEGLPLDFVEVCWVDGSNCVPMTVVAASSAPDLDYGGAQDGPTAQDDTCTESSFTELGAGNWVILGFEDADAEPIDTSSKINVWIGDSACPLIPVGEKPFTVKVGNDAAAPGEFTDVEQCLGTCTVSP